jgi:hypothetical protein
VNGRAGIGDRRHQCPRYGGSADPLRARALVATRDGARRRPSSAEKPRIDEAPIQARLRVVRDLDQHEPSASADDPEKEEEDARRFASQCRS